MILLYYKKSFWFPRKVKRELRGNIRFKSMKKIAKSSKIK